MVKRFTGPETVPLPSIVISIDEFDGDHAEICDFLAQAASTENLEICLSSRPLAVFEQAFKLCPKLRLQDLTRNDIRTYVCDKLDAHSRAFELATEEPELLSRLID